jgi:hypothetical protein
MEAKIYLAIRGVLLACRSIVDGGYWVPVSKVLQAASAIEICGLR